MGYVHLHLFGVVALSKIGLGKILAMKAKSF